MVILDGGTEEMARDLSMQVAAMDPLVAYPDDIDATLLEKERDIYKTLVMQEGKPEEIAQMVVWLASEHGAFATGATFAINGGQYMG